MLGDMQWLNRIGEEDLKVYDSILPYEDPLLDALELIHWDSFVPELESYYNRDYGQPARFVLIMLKLEFLRYFYRLSDREVIARSKTDLLFRWFLQLPLRGRLPDPSLLTRFRGRLGAEGFKKIFDRLVEMAREENLIKDRLRLKDATHVIANIAVPHTLKLLAQLREKMLDAVAVVDLEAAEGFEIEADRIREQTEKAKPAEKLSIRVGLIQDILGWIVGQELSRDDLRWEKLEGVRQLAEKILNDQANPDQGNRTLSVVDPDARRGKHGEWYEGYVVDVMMDADSELITSIEVLPAGGDEAKDAINLVRQEQERHGNQIEQVSIDGAGFNGPMLREFKELNVEVYTPPKREVARDVYGPEAFTKSTDGASVTCPAGQQSKYKQKDKRNATIYRFKRIDCESCPLRSLCKPTLGKGPFGRSVTKNDYELEYAAARARAETPEYKAIRHEHPAIERKLGELTNRHCGRHAQYWGHQKLRLQETMACFAMNVKRVTKLMIEKIDAPTANLSMTN